MKYCIVAGFFCVTLLGGAGWAQEKSVAPQAGVEQPVDAGHDAGQDAAPAGVGGKRIKGGEPLNGKQVWDNFVKDWKGFLNWALIIEIVVSLLMAVLLAMAIAYHPRSYGKATTLEEVDQPKIFLMYAVVGAVVAQIVKAYPGMAYVIFGIGGLFRFRTDVGPARDTGRLILVTCVGLCCGLGIYLVATITTAFAWMLIYSLEARVTHKLVIKGLESSTLGQAADAYHEVLVENAMAVMSEKKNFLKAQVAFVFRAPGELDRDQLEQLFKDIPPKLQGAVDWESS